jgi:hypothetical protein
VADGHLEDAGVGGLEAGEDDGVGDVGGVHHVGVADIVFGAAVAEGELGFDAAGTDDADFDSVGTEFGVEGLAETYLSEFGSAVDGFVGVALQAGNRGYEEDGAAFLRDHRWRGVAGEEEAALHVGVHESVVVFDGGVDEMLVVAGAGVVDEDVEVAEGGEGKGNGLLRGGLFGCVAGVGDGFDADGFEFAAKLVKALFAACGDDQICSLMSKGEGCGPADSSARSGDEGCLAGEGFGLLLHLRCLLIVS